MPLAYITNFSATPLSGAAPLSVQFSDLCSPVPSSWFWDFGDGNTSTLQNPIHVYATPGSYTVTLTPNLPFAPYAQADYITVGAGNPAGGSYKVKVQGGNVFYSSADPADSLNFNIKGQLNVTTDLIVGDNTEAAGTITTYLGQDLTIAPQANLRLSPVGSIVFNNSAWPAGAPVDPGQFLGCTSPAILEFIPFILATGASDNLSTAQLNLSWPFAKTGQWVLGTSAAYLCTGPSTWFRTSSTSGTVTSVGVSGGSTGLTTSGGPITSSGTISLGGVLNLVNGGTGGATAQAAANNILKNISPAPVTGNYLSYNGTDVQWYTPPTGVTSITAGTGLFLSAPATGIGAVTINSSPLNFVTGSGLSINGLSSGSVNLGGTLNFTLATIANLGGGSFQKFTIDSYGRITGTSNVVASDITALGTLTYNGVNTITGLPNPVNGSDAANKQYVDGLAAGVNIHASCETATSVALPSCTYNNGASGVGATLTATANGALGTVGGYAGLAVSSRILVKNQAAQTQNGIYVVTQLGSVGTPWILTRAADFDGSPTSEVEAGDMTYVQEGSNAGTQWVQTTVGTGYNVSPSYDYVIIGTDNIVFTQFAGSGTYTAGSGINIATNIISNTGVLSFTSGTGLSVNTSATGNVFVTNTGVTSNVAGTGITVSAATGAVTISTANIPNSSLTNSSLTVNGTTISLGGSGTVTAAAGTLTGATLNASVTNSSLTSVGTLTSLNVSGNSTIGGRTLRSVSTGIVAAGSGLGTATPLTRDINVVSTVSATQGVSLPTELAGSETIVINASATDLNVYPSVGTARIDSLSLGAPFILSAGSKIMFICISATQWYTLNATYA
jgi:hypothetical protein